MQIARAAANTVAATFVFASAATAQPLPPPDERGPLFVSPMGEPFRTAPESDDAPIRLWFSGADADGDQRLSRAEFTADAMRFFANVLDANHDQSATSLESTALWRAQAPEMLATRTAPVTIGQPERRNEMAGRGPRDAPRRERGPDAPPPLAPRPFALSAEREPVMSCDRDLSRRVDVAEFEDCAARRFATLDADRDGYFTLDDSERARELAQARPPRHE